jgi:hypothetical protein
LTNPQGSQPKREPLRWRIRLATNRLLRREDRCWWCGAKWDGVRCESCGLESLGQGTMVPLSSLPAEVRAAKERVRAHTATKEDYILIARSLMEREQGHMDGHK